MSHLPRLGAPGLSLCGLLALALPATAAAADSAPAAAAPAPASPTTALPVLRVTGSPPLDAGLNLEKPNPTASRLGLTPMETPASVSTLSGETIRARGDRTILDALTRSVGITGAPAPGNGNATLSARGFAGVTSVMQLFDGIQLFVGAGTVTFPYDPWMVDRIDVLSGPASVLYGQGAIGGVVNVIPRKPESIRSTTAQVSVGSYDTSRQAFDTTGPIGDRAAYRLSASNSLSDGWVDRGDSQSLALSGSLRLDPTDDLKILFSHDRGDQRPTGYFGLPRIQGQALSGLRSRNYNVQDETIHWVDHFTQMRTEWTPRDGVALRNSFYYIGTNRHWREAEAYVFQPATGAIQRSQFIEVLHHESQVGDHGDVKLSGSVLGHRNDALVGFDVNDVTFESVSNTPFGGTSSVNPYSFQPGSFVNLAGTAPRFRTQTTHYGFFAEDRVFVTDRLSIVGGARHDEYQLHRTDLTPYAVTNKTLTNTSWRLGTVYDLTPNLAVYFQYATAADPISSLISLSSVQQGFTLATGRQYEAGVKTTFLDGKVQGTIAGYEITKSNILTTNPTNTTQSQQVGQQSSRGFEASMSAELGDGWRIMVNGTALDAALDNFSERVGTAVVSRKGNVPVNVPQSAANLWADWAFAPGWQAGAGLRYVGKRYADNANSVSLPSYLVVDAGVSWTPLTSLRLDLFVYNAFDTLYAAAPQNGGTQWILGPPLSVAAQATLKF